MPSGGLQIVEEASAAGSVRVKWLVMPLIFLVLTGLVLLSDHFGWSDRVVEIFSPIIVISIVLAFVFQDRKYVM